MKFLVNSLIAVLLLGACSSVHAAVIVYDLRDAAIEDIDEAQSFNLTEGSIQATFESQIDGVNDGELNRTGSGFGVNDDSGSDDSDAIDGGAGVERVRISFDQAFNFQYIAVSGLGSSDEGTLTLPGFSPITFTSSGNVPAPGGSVMIDVGEEIFVSHSAGNGFSFDELGGSHVVPEPGTIVLMGLAGIGIWIRRKMQRSAGT